MDRSLMARATSSDSSDTPGYMFREIAKMTHASFEACKQIEEYLVKRCASKNANVKKKSLIIIKHVAASGRPEFKRDMCRQLGVIKDCLSFSGPPDPLRGDEIYFRVREAAKEALEAVTSSAPPPQTSFSGEAAFSSGGVARFEGYGTPAPTEETFSERAQNYASEFKAKALSTLGTAVASVAGPGSNAYVEGGAGDLPSANRMAGIGNPEFQQQGTWQDSVTNLGRRAGTSIRNLGFRNEMKEDLGIQYGTNRGPNAWPSSGSTSGSYDVPQRLKQEAYDSSQSSATSYASQQAAQHHAPEPSAARQRGAVGGSWGSAPVAQNPPPVQQRAAYGGGGGQPPQSYHQPPQAFPPSAPSKRAGEANRDGEYERQLVADLCAAGGTRAAPPADKLAAFVEAAKTLEADVVGPNVLELLDDAKPWQVKCKALAVVEALAREPECEAHKQYFEEVAQDLAHLAEKPPVAVQKNARQALKALGLHVGDAVVGGKRAPRRAANEDQDFDATSLLAASGSSKPLDDTGAVAGGHNDDDGEPPFVASRGGGALDLLGGYDENKPAAEEPPPTEEQQSSSLFGDMQVKDAAADTTPPSPATTPLDDPFAEMTVAAATPSASSAADPFAPVEQPAAAAPAPTTTTTTTKTGGDPFAALTGLPGGEDKKQPAATGPAFVASQHATPAYQQQQMLAAQQQQMQAQMVHLMRQQQMLASQARQMAQPYPAGMMPPQAAPFGVPHSASLPPPSAVQQTSFGATNSGFDFMAGDNKAKAADSFSFVNDMMK